MRYRINWQGVACQAQDKQACIICGGEIKRGETVYGAVLVWTVPGGMQSRFVASHLAHGQPEERK